MSKKKFTEGLDELINEAATDYTASGGAETSAGPGRRASGHKTFATDLDALLEEAMQESLEKYESGKPVENKLKREDGDSRISGIDALIRQTINVEEWPEEAPGSKKRLTVTVDRPKLEKLKVIARLENAYLKDLMVEVIDEFIQSYKREKGIDL